MPTSPLVDEHAELERLRERLAEVEEALRAIRGGEIDAIIVDGPDRPIVYTLKNADNPYRLLVEQMREGALTVSREGVILYCNAAFTHLVGLPSELLRGTHLTELIGDPADLLVASGTSGCDVRLRTNSGEMRNVYVSSAPLAIDGEHVHCVVVTDLTRQELRRRHEAIINSSVDAIYSLTPEGTIRTWNPGAERLYGYTAQEVLGRNVNILFPPLQESSPTITHARLLEEKRLHHETVRISKSGKLIDVAISVALIQNADGEVEGISVIARDITARKRAEEHQRTLHAELDHRVKNVLATVKAIIAQTQETTSTQADFVSGLDHRITSMASTHALLSQGHWVGAALSEIVDIEFAPYGNAEVGGPSVTLKAEAAQAVAMVLHELTTNAAKYGAFSNQKGRVSLRWRWQENGSHARLAIDWQETGGPSVATPIRNGYGTSMVRELIPFELGGTVEITYAREGVRCRLEIPAEWVNPGSSSNEEFRALQLR